MGHRPPPRSPRERLLLPNRSPRCPLRRLALQASELALTSHTAPGTVPFSLPIPSCSMRLANPESAYTAEFG